MARRFLGVLFLFLMVMALVQCARRGRPSGGPKDITPPKLVSADPPNKTTNFKSQKIRLYFNEYIKLKDVQKQLIISPPLKNLPEITPQGGASKYIEIILKDTLKENTTYTINFGQSIEDNNEGNPNSFLTYVFSTGDYLDSLSVTGVILDALNKEPEEFVSVMLYEKDSSYTDSTIYKQPPLYVTNTLDSTNIFTLNNLKAGEYALFALKDDSKNYKFDQNVDKIGFLGYTITLPTDSIFALSLFKEVPDYNAVLPKYAAKNKIIFGYTGDGKDMRIERITPLPDSVRTIISKEPEKDSLNYWMTNFEADSLVFKVVNKREKVIDTFMVKPRKLPMDTLVLKANSNKTISAENLFWVSGNTPIIKVDTSKITLVNKDTVPVAIDVKLDSILNRLNFDIIPPKEDMYQLTFLPEAVTDFFGDTNDTISYRLSPANPEEFGVLRLNLTGAVTYPTVVQILSEKGDDVVREQFASDPQTFEFKNLEPGKYLVRVIGDTNGNKKWDTGSFLKKKFPEDVSYTPNLIEIRAYGEENYTFEIIK